MKIRPERPISTRWRGSQLARMIGWSMLRDNIAAHLLSAAFRSTTMVDILPRHLSRAEDC
jgi:hypothetical protein